MRAVQLVMLTDRSRFDTIGNNLMHIGLACSMSPPLIRMVRISNEGEKRVKFSDWFHSSIFKQLRRYAQNPCVYGFFGTGIS